MKSIAKIASALMLSFGLANASEYSVDNSHTNVGFLALLGVASETSIVMLVYLHEAMVELKQNCINCSDNEIKSFGEISPFVG